MKVKVVQQYQDRYNNEIHNIGETIEISNGRFEEINSTAYNIFVEKIVEVNVETKKTKKTTKSK